MSDPFFFITINMLNGFEKSLAKFIKANELFGSAEKILLAVSGGADSTALMYAMSALKANGLLDAMLFCAHINHQLRGAHADGDEDFVVSEAEKLGIPVIVKKVDVKTFAGENKLSIETAARQLRIEALIDIAKANDINRIATAHHANDNAETILQRLSRGTGFRGLGGIWPVKIFKEHFYFVRPLIYLKRSDIIEYLGQRNLNWRKDHTNEDVSYRRNFIRHKLLPALQVECKDDIVKLLTELADSACGFYKLVSEQADKVWAGATECESDRVSLVLKTFTSQPQPVKVELVLRSLECLGCGQRDLTQDHFNKILDLAEKNESGKLAELPGSYTVSRQYDKLVFESPQKAFKVSEQLAAGVTVEIPGQRRFEDFLVEADILEARLAVFEEFKADKNSFVEWFDLEKLRPPLTIRLRKAGDKFVPLGLSQPKKIGQFLTDAKVPQKIREKILVVEDSEKIIWVWPIRMGQQAKVSSDTQDVLQLRITG